MAHIVGLLENGKRIGDIIFKEQLKNFAYWGKYIASGECELGGRYFGYCYNEIDYIDFTTNKLRTLIIPKCAKFEPVY
jgi:hypothetical protein